MDTHPVVDVWFPVSLFPYTSPRPKPATLCPLTRLFLKTFNPFTIRIMRGGSDYFCNVKSYYCGFLYTTILNNQTWNPPASFCMSKSSIAILIFLASAQFTTAVHSARADPLVPVKTDNGKDPINLIFIGTADSTSVFDLFIFHAGWILVNCWVDETVNGQNQNTMVEKLGPCWCTSFECRAHIRIWDMGTDPLWGHWSIANVHMEHCCDLSFSHIIDSWEDAEALVRSDVWMSCATVSVTDYSLNNAATYQDHYNDGKAALIRLDNNNVNCGGSVAPGTLIPLENRSQTTVQNLSPGMRLLSYDTTANHYTVSTIIRMEVVHTNNQLTIRTQEGLPLRTDNATRQKLWVRQSDSNVGWLSVTRLKVGDYLFNALDLRWVTVTSITYAPGPHTMYDVYVTAPGNYIANNFLDPTKDGPSG